MKKRDIFFVSVAERPLRIKRIAMQWCMLVLCLFVTTANSMALQAGDFTYTTNNNTVTITQYTGSESAVEIPDMIEGLPVTIIGDNAFWNISSLLSVTIPDSISRIRSSAFAYSGLTSVKIPDSVTRIDNYAFYNCRSLTDLSIGNGVTSFGVNAFGVCITLSNVVIGNRVTSIGQEAFANCYLLTSVTIPASVTTIGDMAFYSCTDLTGFYCQGNAPSVGFDVFYYNDTKVLPAVYYRAGTTGWGSSFCARPTMAWNPVIQTADESFGVQPSGFGFNIAESASGLVVVEACTNLTDGSWDPLETNDMNNSTVYFSDPSWTNHLGCHYRLSMP